jgi:predicted RNA-binding protein YlxR (DUF448 family)
MTPRPRHVPQRRCVVCRASLTKAGLVRLVQGDAGWRVDPEGRAGGRGTWVCHTCIAAAGDRATRKAFARAFRQQTDEVVALLCSSRDAVRSTPIARASRHGGTHG